MGGTRALLVALGLAGHQVPAAAGKSGTADVAQQDAVHPIDVYVPSWFDRNRTSEKRATLRVHPTGDPENPLTGVFAPLNRAALALGLT